MKFYENLMKFKTSCLKSHSTLVSTSVSKKLPASFPAPPRSSTEGPALAENVAAVWHSHTLVPVVTSPWELGETPAVEHRGFERFARPIL